MINLMKPPIHLRRGFKDKKHLAKVAQLPCLVCKIRGDRQLSKTQVHHKWGSGAGLKESDRLTIPLCDRCHNANFIKAEKGITLHCNLEAFEDRHGTQDQLIEITNQLLKQL